MKMTRTKSVLFASLPPLFGLLDSRTWFWRASFLVMSLAFGAAAWLGYGSDIDTEAGLQRVTNIQLAILMFQIVGLLFFAFVLAKS